MRLEISKLHKRLQTTIIYVTHDQTEAMTLGTRIVVMKDGVIQQVDSPETLYNQPTNMFVAGFIGSPQMNFIDAQVVKVGSDVVLTFGNNAIKVYEMLGAEVFLYFSLDQYEITARVNPRTTARPGDTIKVAFDASTIHLFDKETEQVITN